MNQLAGAGVDPDAVDADELGKLVEARERIPRAAFVEALAARRATPTSPPTATSPRPPSPTRRQLEPIVDEVLAAHPGEVEAYRGGKQGLLGFFVGQVMGRTQGKADAKVVNELLREKLGA